MEILIEYGFSFVGTHYTLYIDDEPFSIPFDSEYNSDEGCLKLVERLVGKELFETANITTRWDGTM